MKKINIFATFTAAVIIASGTSSDAACVSYGKVDYMYKSDTGSTYVYITPPAKAVGINPYVYIYTIPHGMNELVSIISSAMVTGNTVYLSGDAAICPASGTFRIAGSTTMGHVYRSY